MIGLYRGVFASFHHACRWVARDDRFAPESAAVLMATLQFLNAMTIVLVFEGGTWLSTRLATTAALCFGLLILLNLWCFLGGARWKSAVAEFHRQESARGVRFVAGIYFLLSVVLFFTVAW